MIILINGSFGVGKTTVAEKLVKELPNSMLFDPEEIGFMLRKILEPIEWTGDFQDYIIWRSLFLNLAESLKETYQKTLVIPMTLWREDYFKQIVEGLKEIDSDFYHFCLVLSVEDINKRIRARGEQKEGDWIFGQVEKCVQSFKSELFDRKIDVSDMSPDKIVQYIIGEVIKKNNKEH